MTFSADSFEASDTLLALSDAGATAPPKKATIKTAAANRSVQTASNPVYQRSLQSKAYAGRPYQYGTTQSAASAWLDDFGAPLVAAAKTIGNAAVALSPVSLINTVKDIANGARIDKALVGQLKSQVAALKTLAPYVQAVVSLVPGIGTGAAAAIAAGAALADGKSIDDAMLAGVRGALPGGALGQAAFDTATGVILHGKRVDQAALDAMRNQVPPAARPAFDVGVAMATGKTLQNALVSAGTKALGELGGPLATRALGALDPLAQVGKAAKAAFSTLGPSVATVANALAKTPALRNVPIADLAKRFKVHESVARDAMSAVVSAVSKMATSGGTVPALKVDPNLVKRLASNTTLDKAVAQFASRAAPPTSSVSPTRRPPMAAQPAARRVVAAAPAKVVVKPSKAILAVRWMKLSDRLVDNLRKRVQLPAALVKRVQNPGPMKGSAQARGFEDAGALPMTYKVASGDAPFRIAARFGVTLGALAAANPAKKSNILAGKIFPNEILNLPANAVDKGPSTQAKGQASMPAPIAAAPPQAAPPPAAPPSAAPPASPRTYTVASGDAPFKIATRFGVTLAALAAANPAKKTNIFAGRIFPNEVLLLPPGAVDKGRMTQANGLTGQTPPASPPALTPAPPPSAAPPSSTRTYTVASGDAPFKIAMRFGVTLAALAAANPAKKSNILAGKIFPNETLNLPAGSVDGGPITQAKGRALGVPTKGAPAPPLTAPPSAAPPASSPHVLQAQFLLAGWSQVERQTSYGIPSDLNGLEDARFHAALQSYQRWANAKGERLPSDGDLDDATYQSLVAWAAENVAKQVPAIPPIVPTVPSSPPIVAPQADKGPADNGGVAIAATLAALIAAAFI